jgi:hypothetical protein
VKMGIVGQAVIPEASLAGEVQDPHCTVLYNAYYSVYSTVRHLLQYMYCTAHICIDEAEGRPSLTVTVT